MSRIHDALRRAEEQLRIRGNGAASPPADASDTSQELEILEVLRVTEESPGGLSGSRSVDLPVAPPLEAFPSETLPSDDTWQADLKAGALQELDEAPPRSQGWEPIRTSDGSHAPRGISAVGPRRPADIQDDSPPVASLPRDRGAVPERPVSVEAGSAYVPSNAPIRLEDLVSRCREVDWKPDTQRMLSFDLRSTNPVGLEEFRTLRSRLYQLRTRQQTLSRILITSALPGEGKTFVSSNLAQVLVRQRGRRALLIDCDLRLSRLHEVLGAPVAPGVTEYLRGEVDEFDIVQRGPLENLFFIPGGRSASNPADLLAGNRLGRLLDRLGPLFDWVIVDTPPAVPIADSSVIANLCHGVLIVVNSAHTPFDLAQKACREFRQTPVLGVVLNRVPKRATYSRYYYSGYESGEAKGQ